MGFYEIDDWSWYLGFLTFYKEFIHTNMPLIDNTDYMNARFSLERSAIPTKKKRGCKQWH